jgi:hypothetical protein
VVYVPSSPEVVYVPSSPEVVYVQLEPAPEPYYGGPSVNFGVNLPDGSSFGVGAGGGSLSFGITLPGF